jgi:hypothetical protein
VTARAVSYKPAKMCLFGIPCSDLFRDYGGVIVSALPAVAAFLAMIIAQYFKERPIAKALSVAAAGLLILASIGVNAAYQHQLNAEKAANVTRQAAKRAARQIYRRRQGHFPPTDQAGFRHPELSTRELISRNSP